jgi:hypothetical protein
MERGISAPLGMLQWIDHVVCVRRAPCVRGHRWTLNGFMMTSRPARTAWLASPPSTARRVSYQGRVARTDQDPTFTDGVPDRTACRHCSRAAFSSPEPVQVIAGGGTIGRHASVNDGALRGRHGYGPLIADPQGVVLTIRRCTMRASTDRSRAHDPGPSATRPPRARRAAGDAVPPVRGRASIWLPRPARAGRDRHLHPRAGRSSCSIPPALGPPMVLARLVRGGHRHMGMVYVSADAGAAVLCRDTGRKCHADAAPADEYRTAA